MSDKGDQIWDQLFSYSKGILAYADSVSLYAKIFPQNKAMISFFRKEDRYSRKRLKTELDKKFEEMRRHKEAVDFKTFSPVKHQKLDLEKLPAALRVKHGELGPIIREISHLHSRLYSCKNNKQRYNLALQIHELTGRRREIFTEIDDFLETGQLPDQPRAEKRQALPELKNFEVEYKLKLLRTRRTKLAKNKRRAFELKEVKKQIAELEKSRYA